MNNKGLEALAALASAAPSPGETVVVASASTGSSQHHVNQADSKTAPAAKVSTGQQTASLPPPMSPADGTGIVQGTMQQLGGVAIANTQQLQQALALRAGLNQGTLAPSNPGVLAGLQQISQADTASLLAMQQLNCLKYLIQAQAAAQQNLQAAPTSAGPSQALRLNLSMNGGTPLLQKAEENNAAGRPPVVPSGPAVLPNGSAVAQGHVQAPLGVKVAAGITSSMPPPKPMTTAQPITVSTASVPSPQQHPMIAPQPGFAGSTSLFDGSSNGFEAQQQDKKQQKRAANRRSAQLSRKRKKQFIEELKEENDELRRKEQILLSIPDLIVVFNSSGELWFVSKSVSRFLSFSSTELEGTSFWDRLCEDSVRLLKAAFMDSLAAREANSDTAPLGSGVWELRLVDKDGSQKIVALSGVVHFAGDRPECVCSIRPRDEPEEETELPETESAEAASEIRPERSDCSDSFLRSLVRVKPQQSVVSTSSSSHGMQARKKARAVGKRGEAVRISDSGNSSVESESGSSDESGCSDEMTGAAS